MADIFISYSSNDRTVIARLAENLAAEGFSVFWDVNLSPGQTYRQVITEELSVAKCVLVAWSKHSVESRWVVDEAEKALELRRLIPIALDASAPPLGFRQIHTARFQGWTNSASDPRYVDLVQSLRARCATPSSEEPPAQSPLIGEVTKRHLLLFPTKILPAIAFGLPYLAGYYLMDLRAAAAIVLLLGLLEAGISGMLKFSRPFMRWSVETNSELIPGYILIMGLTFLCCWLIPDAPSLTAIAVFWSVFLPIRMFVNWIARMQIAG